MADQLNILALCAPYLEANVLHAFVPLLGGNGPVNWRNAKYRDSKAWQRAIAQATPDQIMQFCDM